MPRNTENVYVVWIIPVFVWPRLWPLEFGTQKSKLTIDGNLFPCLSSSGTINCRLVLPCHWCYFESTTSTTIFPLTLRSKIRSNALCTASAEKGIVSSIWICNLLSCAHSCSWRSSCDALGNRIQKSFSCLSGQIDKPKQTRSTPARNQSGVCPPSRRYWWSSTRRGSAAVVRWCRRIRDG